MQPDPSLHCQTKLTQCPINNQINRYRNSLPEVDRSQNHFFFKQVHNSEFQISYVTIGYRVQQVPFQLMDMFAVIINDIHCFTDCNLKLIMIDDSLWVTSTTGYSQDFVGSLEYNIEESNLNDSLLKARNLLSGFMQKTKKRNRIQDKKVLEQVKNYICKSLMLAFKNPHLDD